MSTFLKIRHYKTGLNFQWKHIFFKQQTYDKMKSDLLNFELVDMFYTKDITQQAILS